MATQNKLTKRILKEFSDAQGSSKFDFLYDETGIFHDMTGNSGMPYCYIKFKVESGAYAGQIHVLQLQLRYGHGKNEYIYPVCPPNVIFITPIFHPNISEAGGSICVDVLNTENWSPLCGFSAIVSSIILLLDMPNNSSPLNGSAATANAKKSAEEYKKMCEEHYKKHLTGSSKAKIILDTDFKKLV